MVAGSAGSLVVGGGDDPGEVDVDGSGSTGVEVAARSDEPASPASEGLDPEQPAIGSSAASASQTSTDAALRTIGPQ